VSRTNFAFLMVLILVFSGLKVVHGQENFRTTYYDQRRTLFESLPNTRNEIVFLGNSITDGGECTEHMDPAFTNDGLHLTGPGYLKWAEILKPFL
jgi:lysophospholipase L1-like esterase